MLHLKPSIFRPSEKNGSAALISMPSMFGPRAFIAEHKTSNNFPHTRSKLEANARTAASDQNVAMVGVSIHYKTFIVGHLKTETKSK